MNRKKNLPIWWPVWTPISGRYPWRIKHLPTGELLRTPPRGREHKAYVFHTAEAALNFMKNRLGQRAIKENVEKNKKINKESK